MKATVKQTDSVTDETTVSVTPQKYKVVISSEITDLSSIFNLPYLPRGDFSFDFTIYEQIEFNLRNGHTCVRVMDDNGRILHTTDITNSPAVLAECEIAELFNTRESVKQMIIECFQSVSKTAIPIEPSDIFLEDFVFLTRFVGYDKSFYSAIPYDKETLIIDRSFKNLDKLHTVKNAVEYLGHFEFAKYKSTRKQVCKQSGLLFFLPEYEALFRAIGDINVFRSIIGSLYGFDILLTLHEHPDSSEFFSDFCKAKGADNLFKVFNSPRYLWYDFRCYLLSYCSLSRYGKSLERKKWMGKSASDFIFGGKPTSYSLPIMQSFPKEATCIIDGFYFKPLRNTSECLKAGKELRNCLGEWESHDSAVVAVIYEKGLVAAFDIWSNAIAQAHTYNNGSIDEIEGLPEAIDKWALRNNVKCSKDELIEGW